LGVTEEHEMTPDHHDVLALIDRFNRAWNDHDLPEALSMVTDDAVFEATGPFPDGSRHVGRAALGEAWTGIFGDPASHFEFEEIVVLGDRVVQRFRYSWGDGHIRGIDLISLRDGKIAEKLSYVKG
jgi:ketosteroid isomerase-like protein